MDLGSERWVDESVEDNEGINGDSVSEEQGSTSESKIQNNGYCVVENNDLNHKEAGHVELKPEAASSPFNSTPRKGYGLKKWRRIKRDVSRDGSSSVHTGETEARDNGANRSKRVQYGEEKQKSEDSVSSTKAVVRSFDGLPLLNDSSLGLSPSFAAGTDSENSEDRSSKSSTAASAPKIKYDIPLIGGFPRDKSKMSSLNGKNWTLPVQFGQRGKGQTETGKKTRGERVKIEKANSHSSVESDSRSSNFVFVQGTSSVSNGVLNEYDGENGKQVNGGHQDGYGEDGGEGFEGLSPEDGAADSSWAHKYERCNNQDKDQVAESNDALQSAQEALQEEVLKFKEIGNDVSVDGSISGLYTEDVGVETSGEQVLQSEVVETELEDLFKQKIEAEVELLTISRTIQKLRVAAADQISVLEDYKSLLSEQTHILKQHRDAGNKAAILRNKAAANVEELLKLQKRVCKYGSCFALQLILLLVLFFGGFALQFSQDYVEFVPT